MTNGIEDHLLDGVGFGEGNDIESMWFARDISNVWIVALQFSTCRIAASAFMMSS